MVTFFLPGYQVVSWSLPGHAFARNDVSFLTYMKIIDFEIADGNLTKITVVTEPRVSQKVYDIAKDLLKNMNFPPPSLHAGKLVFPNAQLIANPATMQALRQVLGKAEKQVNEVYEREEQKKLKYINQFRQAAGLTPKESLERGPRSQGQGEAGAATGASAAETTAGKDKAKGE